MEEQEDIRVIADDHLGDTVITTTLLSSLRAARPTARITAHAKNADLLFGLTCADAIRGSLPPGDARGRVIDLRHYVRQRDPQRAQPLRHLSAHQHEVAEEALGIRFERATTTARPRIALTDREDDRARAIHAELSGGRPLVWLHTKTSEARKDWDPESWQAVRRLLRHCRFVDLADMRFDRRTSAALTRHCAGGITLDTFGLHASQAAGARNVIAVMTDSEPAVVCYPDQTVFGRPGLPPSPHEIASAMADMLT